MENEMFSNKKNQAEFLREYERLWNDHKTSKFEIHILMDGEIIARADREAPVEDKVTCLKQLARDIAAYLNFLIAYMEGDANGQT